MTTTTPRARLNAKQVQQYRQDGYTLFQEQVFSPHQFDRLNAIFEENLKRYGEEDLDTIHFRDPRLLEFLLSDAVLDLVQPLVGENIGLWSSHFISKPAGTGKATPWHEDSAYWEGAISTMEGICTVWLALDKVDAGNGAMKVIPGTHTNGFSSYESADSAHNIFDRCIKAEQVDESRAVVFQLEPGQASLHEARIIHGADANTSMRRRAGYTMRYFPLTSKVHLDYLKEERGWTHHLWLARGKDLAGNSFYNVPGDPG